jgi:phosphomevalonate kinase
VDRRSGRRVGHRYYGNDVERRAGRYRTRKHTILSGQERGAAALVHCEEITLTGKPRPDRQPKMAYTKSATVSAPGKVLLAGGYLVLQSPNPGLVIALDKRFYTTATLRFADSATDVVEIVVRSVQFGGQTYQYTFQKADKTLIAGSSNKSRNVFVEKSLRVSFLCLYCHSQHAGLAKLELGIKADNDFYSLVPHLQERGMDRSLESVLKLPKWLPAATSSNNKVLKTGLGSSACLVTSIVGALCHVFLQDEPSSLLVHNLAQICHCHAQQKVGSGFDVAAACHGSHVYQRFPPSTLESLLSQLDSTTTDDQQDGDGVPPLLLASLTRTLRSVVHEAWEGGVVAPIHLPKCLQIMLADVSGGSESPSMARTVLAWQQQSFHGARVPHWDDLVVINQRIVEKFQQVKELVISKEDTDVLEELTADQWQAYGGGENREVGPTLYELRMVLQESRRELKAMGDAAQVPIEPEEQTFLIDATMALPGVVAALVPGAGGNDALACVYLNTPVVRHRIADLWAQWERVKVCPLSAQAVGFGDGVRLETQLLPS